MMEQSTTKVITPIYHRYWKNVPGISFKTETVTGAVSQRYFSRNNAKKIVFKQETRK